jgi:hypothetical protein
MMDAETAMWASLLEHAKDWRYACGFVLSLLSASVMWLYAPEFRYFVPLVALLAPISAFKNAFIQRYHVRRLGGGDVESDLKLTQTRTFVLELPFDEALESCIGAMRALPRSHVGRCDRSRGVIVGRSTPMWYHQSNRIRFQLTQLDGSRTKVELISHPLYHYVLMDSGVNYDNAERLTATLGVKPDQYLLRAAHASDSDDVLLRPAAGAPTESAHLLRPDIAGEPEHTHDQRYDHEPEPVQHIQQGTVSR